MITPYMLRRARRAAVAMPPHVSHWAPVMYSVGSAGAVRVALPGEVRDAVIAGVHDPVDGVVGAAVHVTAHNAVADAVWKAVSKAGVEI